MESQVFTKTDKNQRKEVLMREKMVTILYVVASFIDDIAYWVVGKGEDEKERTIRTFWGHHYY